MADLLTTSNLQQGSYGFDLLLPFTYSRGDDNPVWDDSDTWEVKIIKYGGEVIVKTTSGDSLYFPNINNSVIAVPIVAFDLDRQGDYWYQVTKTTDDTYIKSNRDSFTVLASLPEGLTPDIVDSPLADTFPIFNNLGMLDSSLLTKNGSNLLYNTKLVTPFPVFNLKDYGGVSDGTTDDAAAFQTIFDLMKNTSPAGGIIIVPKGTAVISSAVSTNFNASGEGKNPAILIMGMGSSSRIKVTGLSDTPAITLANMTSLGIQDLTVIGNLASGATPDCSCVFKLGYCESVSVKRAQFYGVFATSEVVGSGVFFYNNCSINFEDVQFLGCTGGHYGVVTGYNTYGFSCKNMHFIDYGLLDGVNYTYRGGGSKSWIAFTEDLPSVSARLSRAFTISDCFMDEGTTIGIWCDGGQILKVDNLSINGGIEYSTGLYGIPIVANDLEQLQVTNSWFGYSSTVGKVRPSVKATNVGVVKFDGVKQEDGVQGVSLLGTTGIFQYSNSALNGAITNSANASIGTNGVKLKSITSSATPAINTDIVNKFNITALAVDITSLTTNLTGTPIEGQSLVISITGTGTRNLTFGSGFESSGTVSLPATATTIRTDIAFVFNSGTGKFRCVGIS